MCSKRSAYAYYRMPTYNIPRALLFLIMGLMLASIYAPQGQGDFKSLYGSIAAMFVSLALFSQTESTPAIDGK